MRLSHASWFLKTLGTKTDPFSEICFLQVLTVGSRFKTLPNHSITNFQKKNNPHLGAHFGIKSQKNERRELSFLALERDPSKNHVWRVPGSLPGASWEPLGASWEPPGSLLGLSFGGSWVYWLMDGLVGCRASRIEFMNHV